MGIGRRNSDDAARPPGRGDGTIAIPSEDAVRAELERLLASTGFRYSERLSRFLKFVVEQHLAGNSAQLKESVLAVEIFDRGTTYDSRVDSVVRVEARRLREKLDRYYSGEGREDPVVVTLPKGSYAPVISLREVPAGETSSPTSGPRQIPGKVIWAGAAVVLVLLATVAIVRWAGSSGSAPSQALRRLTSDPGLTFQPALSPDGKLLAYSSDRSGKGDFDIWVQQMPAGDPLRVTDNPADDVEPSFSPDGMTIAYRAEGDNEGIYVVPALGGKSTLIARGGYRPRFSPDGTRIAYWTGARTFRTAKVFIVPVKGGAPVQVQADFSYAAFPVWSPDGQFLMFVGAKEKASSGDPEVDDWDWWVAPANGGAAVRASARKRLEAQGLRPPEIGWGAHLRLAPCSWTASNQIVFSARSGEQVNIWRIPVSRNHELAGRAQQLTLGAGRQDHPTVGSDGSLAFSVIAEKSDVWALSLADGAHGPKVKLTSGPARYSSPVVSSDGRRIAFLASRHGDTNVSALDVGTGRESVLTATREPKSGPVLSADGSKVAFGLVPPLTQAIFVVPFAGGQAQHLCDDCGQPRTWLPDGSGLLYQRISAAGESVIGLLKTSGESAPLVRSSESALFSPSMSADGNWVALIVRTPPMDHRVMVAPFRKGTIADRTHWVSVAGPGPWVDKPRWARSGDAIYFVSDQDGFVCIWTVPVDPGTKRPTGEPKPVIHFHDGRSSLSSVYGLELSAAADKLVFAVHEASGNIWLAPTEK